MTAGWTAIALLIGAHVFSGAAIAQDPAPNATSSTTPVLPALIGPAPSRSAAPDEGPMVAPVKRMKPVTPDTKAKDIKSNAVTPAAAKPAGAKAKPRAAESR